ncbi:hypothetical protein JOM56_007547 [Amanita muscaria]
MQNHQVIDVDETVDLQMVDLTQDDDITLVDASWVPRVPTRPYSTSYHHLSNSPSVNGSTKRKRPPSSSQGPSRAKTPEIIALDSETSDSEGEVVEQLTSPPPKRTKQDYGDDDLKYDLHSDEDEDNRFPSPTVEHIIWKPVPVKVHSPKIEQIDDDSVPSTPVTSRQPKRRTDKSSLITRWQEPVANNNNDMIGNFDRLRSSCSIRNRNALCSLDWRSKRIGSMTLSKTSSFKQSPGSIMCIIQKQDWVVVCSICEGDHPDQPDGKGQAFGLFCRVLTLSQMDL